MNIKNSTPQDLELIFQMYELATNYQQARSIAIWPTFDKKMVQTEIENKLQFKLLIDNQVACVWAIAFEEKQIWQEK